MNTINNMIQLYKTAMQKNEKRTLVAEMLRKGASARAIVKEAQVSFNLVAEVRRELNQAGKEAESSTAIGAKDSATESTTDSAKDSATDSAAEAPKGSEQSYLSAIRRCISDGAAELLLFREKNVERDSLVALTRNLAGCMGNFTQYLALKGTLETTYSRRANKLLDLLRRVLANDPPAINYDICTAAEELAEVPLTMEAGKARCQDADLAEIIAYRPPASPRLKEAFSSQKLRLAAAKMAAYKMLGPKG